ncbi:putative chromosome-partitioning protein ParB [compost metagenome]
MKDENLVKQLAKQSIDQQWSVRELEEAVQQLDRSKTGEAKAKAKLKKKDPFIDTLEESLRERFKTTVKIKHGQKDKGKIELNYYSKQDLERLLELLQ